MPDSSLLPSRVLVQKNIGTPRKRVANANAEHESNREERHCERSEAIRFSLFWIASSLVLRARTAADAVSG